MPILKLREHDEEKELKFELDYLLSLTTAERFRMLEEASRFMMETLIRHGHRKPFEIIKRRI